MMFCNESLREKCYGCYACANACAMSCIELTEDDEGFKYPITDEKICTGCGNCARACPIGKCAKTLNPEVFDAPYAYACYVLDEVARKRSASGGMAFAVSEYVINQGGVVFGVVGKTIAHVYHTSAESIEGVYPMCNSKYIQSDIGETYRQAEHFLKADRLVLYTGTPCQIAGLFSFLGVTYTNLVTCDLVCHGVPSHMVMREYLREIEEKTGKKVINYERQMVSKYYPTQRIMQFDDNSFVIEEPKDSYYYMGFLANLYQRKSCYICQYEKIPRVSDFSLADAYDPLLSEVLRRLDPKCNMGVSLITVNSNKAYLILNEISDAIYKEPLDFDRLKDLPHLCTPPAENKNRELFFKDFYKEGFGKAAERHLITGYAKLLKVLPEDSMELNSYVIFGAGHFGVELARDNRVFEKLLFFIDNDTEKQKEGIEINGKTIKVLSVDSAIALLDEYAVIVIASSKYADEIYETLKSYNTACRIVSSCAGIYF